MATILSSKNNGRKVHFLIVTAIGVSMLSGCAAENCFRTSGSGIEISIGCTKEMQPITEREVR